MQVEYATDLVFRTPAILKPLYEQLSRQAILTVKAEHVATFLGHKITAQLAQEIGSQFTTRIEGTCVKHRFSKSDQDLRQIRPRPAHRDHHQRRLRFQALPQGGTSPRPGNSRPGPREKDNLQPQGLA